MRAETKFAEVVNGYGGMVYSLAFHFFRNEGWAEEITQDVFLQFLRSGEGLEAEAHIEAWLRRTTMHRCIDVSRKRAFRAERPFTEHFEPASEGAEQDFLAYDRLREQLAELPVNQRAVITLRFQEEMEPTEIAQVLQIPVNTVKSRLHRGLETLRTKMTARKRQAV